MNAITIYKHDHHGRSVLQYGGLIREQGEGWVCLEARFKGPETDLGFVRFTLGDRFTEWFYADRWYNIFQIEGAQGLKGWYCNITRPAEIRPRSVSADDLALDVFVTPQGEFLLLDEDEFDALMLAEEEQQAALAAVDTLRGMVARRESPFDIIAP